MSNLDTYTNYKTVLSVNALIFSEGKLLLLKRAANKQIDPNLYAGIGGKVEPNEDFYSALLREIKEETGITKLKSVRLYSVTQHPFPPQNCEWVNLYFLVTIEKQVDIPKSVDGEFFWIDPKEVDRYNIVYDLTKYIKILNKNPNAFIFGFFNHNKKGERIKEKIKII